MRKEFFLDTANEDELRRIWDFVNLQSEVECIGITTNPNALAKIGCDTLAKFEKVIPKLVELTTEMRGGRPLGLVHVQIPSSTMEDEDILRWAEWVNEFSDGYTTLALKIPHQTRTLRLASRIDYHGLKVNVTGISDWATLCKAFQYKNVKYASLIPGRMEEVGINANTHMEYIRQIARSDNFNRPRNYGYNDQVGIKRRMQMEDKEQSVIAGSMRTIKGLHDAIVRGTVPTIGMRVWGDLLKPSWKTGKHAVSDFTKLWDHREHYPVVGGTIADFAHAPLVTDTNIQLSVDFFDQMDKLGDTMHKEFIK